MHNSQYRNTNYSISIDEHDKIQEELFESLALNDSNTLKSNFYEEQSFYRQSSSFISSSYSSSNYEINPSSLNSNKQLLLGSTLENMDVIKEFRSLFLEKYLEKNKIGRKSKLYSKSKNNKLNSSSSKISVSDETNSSSLNLNLPDCDKLNEYCTGIRINRKENFLNAKDELEKFQIEFFNSQPDLLSDLNYGPNIKQSQCYSLNLNSFNYSDKTSLDYELKQAHLISNSYSGHYTSLNENNQEIDKNSTSLDCIENDFNFRSSFKQGEDLSKRYDLFSETQKQNDDDNKIFNLEIESKYFCTIKKILKPVRTPLYGKK